MTFKEAFEYGKKEYGLPFVLESDFIKVIVHTYYISEDRYDNDYEHQTRKYICALTSSPIEASSKARAQYYNLYAHCNYLIKPYITQEVGEL